MYLRNLQIETVPTCYSTGNWTRQYSLKYVFISQKIRSNFVSKFNTCLNCYYSYYINNYGRSFKTLDTNFRFLKYRRVKEKNNFQSFISRLIKFY